MNDILRTTKLDFYLLKYYTKTIIFTILIPILFVIINRSLLSGISFSMTMIAMTSGYTFSVSEKNNMNRLYGSLPISKSDMVIGRYLLLLFIGIITLIFSLVVDTIVLQSLNLTITKNDVLLTGIVGLIFYIIYISFQLPGYYKFGSIRGRVFVYFPALGFLLTIFVLDKQDTAISSVIKFIEERTLLAIIGIFILLLSIYCISIIISTKILINKED